MKILPKYAHLISIGVIFTAAILSYGNSFQNAFHFDDFYYIYETEIIKNLQNFDLFWQANPTRIVFFYSLALNYFFHQDAVFGFHLVNFTIHLVNSFFVYGLSLYLLKTLNQKVNFIPLFCALLFATHPIQTQSVTYIVQRAASLVSLFYMGSLFFFVISGLYKKGGGKKGYRVFYVLSLLFCVVAMFCKQNAFTLPIMIWVVQMFFFGCSKKKFRDSLFYLWPFLICLLIIPLLTFFVGNEEWVEFQNYRDEMLTSREYFLTQIHVIWTYLRLLIFPFFQNFDYDYPLTRQLNPWTFFCFFGLIAFFSLSFVFFKKNRLISFAIIWFFVTLSIESSFIPLLDVIFEHRLYLPSFGIFFLVSCAWAGVCQRITSLNGKEGIAYLVIPCLIFLTIQRNKVWATEESLWLNVVQKSPEKVRPHLNLAQSYHKNGKFSHAERHLSIAIQIDPLSDNAFNNMGIIQLQKGEYERAYYFLEKAVKINPKLSQAQLNLYQLLINQKKWGEALDRLNQYNRVFPNDKKIDFQFVFLFEQLGEYKKALEHLENAKKNGFRVDERKIIELKMKSDKKTDL